MNSLINFLTLEVMISCVGEKWLEECFFRKWFNDIKLLILINVQNQSGIEIKDTYQYIAIRYERVKKKIVQTNWSKQISVRLHLATSNAIIHVLSTCSPGWSFRVFLHKCWLFEKSEMKYKLMYDSIQAFSVKYF